MTPINKNKVQLTPQGYNELKKELKALREENLPQVVERISMARSLGDLSENYEYQAAKEEHSNLVGRIEELTGILNRSQVIKKSTSNTKVGVGHQVDIAINGSSHTFTIVGEWEADPQDKKISHKSPLGQALIDKGVGDKVEVEAPAGKVTYTIKAIK
jgi:transcription elongation factor GreA